jgi:TetR/AcrR family transcriptional regulator, regulator of cefoperazone and chloramphenicol sensitivity
MLREVTQPSGACEELVREYIRPHFEMLLGVLSELVPPATGDVARHRIAFGIVGQCLHYRIAQPIVRLLISTDEYRQYDPAGLAAHITQWTLAALGLAAPTFSTDSSLPKPSLSTKEHA